MPPSKEVSSAAKSGDTVARAQAVALEVPVMVNGARAVEGSNKREPFSETTTTVLVMGKGAVIRLSVPVTQGQLLFLTNTKTRKEVVCQVVKSKNYRNVSGYVELEFTEPVVGFWGLRFPADPTGAQSGSSTLAVAPGAPAEPLAPAVRSNGTGANRTPVLPSPPAAQRSAPAATEFASTESLKSQTARLQSQLSSMSFGPTATKPATPAPTERESATPEGDAARTATAKSEPARAKQIPAVKIPEIKAALDVEEVKIPSWLEPLARNAAAPMPVAPGPVGIPEEVTSSKPAVLKPTGQPERVREEAAALATDLDRAAGPAAKNAAAVFGSRLLNENLELPAAKASRGNHATLVGAFAAVMVLVAGAYWYVQPKSRAAVSSPTTAAGNSTEVARAVPTTAPQTVSANSKLPAPREASEAAVSANVVPEAALGATSRGPQANASAAVYTDKTGPKTNVGETSLLRAQPTESPKPTAKKPNLGAVRLAAPTVNGRRRATAADAPNLDLDGQASPKGDALGNGLVSGSQPVAPPSLPLGGDVKPARLSVSVAPVYPAIARSQRISGDVHIDALIDVNGRVSEMKVISGPAILHQAARDALRHWKYVPATLDGNPVPMHLTVTIQFRLQ